MKHVILLFLSEMHNDRDTKGLSMVKYKSDIGEFECIQTNEAAVKYMLTKLENEAETLDKIFLFVTKKIHEKFSIKINGKDVDHTHIEWFTIRLVQECPQLADRFETIPYDEDKPVESSIAQIASMAQKIRDYVNNVGMEVKLHADMTGGFRHTSMMMLSVMQLLKYSGLKMGKVLYANFQKQCIEDVTDIHQIFGLVSGAEEFINFGSVKAIEEYFAAKPELVKSTELQDLLTAIREFSDAVRICRTGKFEELLAVLDKKISAFEAFGNKSLQEKLFAEIIETIKDEYKGILGEKPKRTAIISWCIRKGFLQQAMTLYTEWIPLQIVADKIYYPAIEYQAEIIEKCQSKNQVYKKWQTVFVNEFIYKNKLDSEISTEVNDGLKVSTKPLSIFRLKVREAVQTNKNVKLTPPFDTGHIRKIMAEIYSLDKINVVLNYDEKTIAANYPTAYKIIQAAYQPIKNSYSHGWQVFLNTNLNKTYILKTLDNMKTELLTDLLQLKFPKEMQQEKQSQRNTSESIEQRWLARKKNVGIMLAKGAAKSDMAEPIIYDLLYSLHWLRSQRNQINHAYDGVEVAASQEIITVINKSLKLLGDNGNE